MTRCFSAPQMIKKKRQQDIEKKKLIEFIKIHNKFSRRQKANRVSHLRIFLAWSGDFITPFPALAQAQAVKEQFAAQSIQKSYRCFDMKKNLIKRIHETMERIARELFEAETKAALMLQRNFRIVFGHRHLKSRIRARRRALGLPEDSPRELARREEELKRKRNLAASMFQTCWRHSCERAHLKKLFVRRREILDKLAREKLERESADMIRRLFKAFRLLFRVIGLCTMMFSMRPSAH